MSKTRGEVSSYLDEQGSISAEYVVAHATRQRQRGRNPAASYKGIKNPRKALVAAQAAMASETKKATVAYGEDFRFIYRFEPPVEIDEAKLAELKSSNIISDIQIGEGPINNRAFLTVGNLEDIAALALCGPDSWGSPGFETRASEISADIPDYYGNPAAIAEQLTALFEGEHIGHVVSYDQAPSDKNIMGNPNCW